MRVVSQLPIVGSGELGIGNLRNSGVQTRAHLFDVQRFSVRDGPGTRTTVFFKGCPLRCAWGQNPESQEAAPQLMLYPDLCMNCGACEEA